MANIRKIEGKTGTSYKITVAHGRDINGKQIRHYHTWIPDAKMTQRQIERELNRAAVDFERKILDGYAADNRQTFSAYAEYVLELKERTGTKLRTLERYRDLLGRINEAIGHLRITDIRPQHLNAFYANLGEAGVRKDGRKATPKADIAPVLKERGFTRGSLAAVAHVSASTITAITKGKRVTQTVADAVCEALGVKAADLFSIEANSEPLSVKTVLEHHRLISTVLKQAEKEMIVQYNAAARATPPKIPQKEAGTFQPEDVVAIRDALESEPLKWKTLTHLLLITGARRGEIAGLQWSRVDWENAQIKIDRALLYSRSIGIYEDTTKTSTTRFIKLPAETMALLREYRLWYLELQMKNGNRWEDSGYLFVKENGAPMHPDSITDWMGKFAHRHGLPHVNPHKFRHTMASLLYFNGADAVAVSKRLGHAKISTTQNFYAHFIAQADEQSAESIADAILRRPPKPASPAREIFSRTAF